MKLTRKLLLGIVTVILVAMAFNAWLAFRREKTQFEADVLRDHQFLGRTMRAMFLATYRERGEDAARALVRVADVGYPPVHVRVVGLGARVAREDLPDVPREQLAAVARGEEAAFTSQRRYYTWIPLAVPDNPPDGPLALEISESLRYEQVYVRENVLRIVLTTAVMLAVSVLIASLLGFWMVGRPMARLRDKARRVGTGDLSGPLYFRAHDEVRELADEMNAMCERLAGAQRRIGEETAARIAAIEQLRHADRLRTVGQLASGLAHELGTPLNVVRGRAAMLTGGDAAQEEVVHNARIIVEQADAMTALIRQLLDFARRRGPRLEPFALDEVVARTAQMLGPLAERHRVKLAVEPAGARGAVMAEIDPAQIRQVVTNLAVNAIQAMPDGGTLALRVGTRRARPPAEHGGAPGEFAFVEVADTGQGIAAEHLSRLFEPFFTTKDVGEGTGLGLSVAYGIARDHRGWIDVQSELGRGSRFTLYLPRNAAEGAAAAVPQEKKSA